MNSGMLTVELVKLVTTPAVVIRPIELTPMMVNHSAPSGPVVMPVDCPDRERSSA